MKLLVVEDERKTAAYLRKGLSENGFVVDVADDGASGQVMSSSHAYNLLILDILLPHCDGLSILRTIRSAGNAVPVIFLTGRDSLRERVLGLESGADDYLVKPFAFSELLARVRCLLRRGQAPLQEKLCIEDLEIDLLGHRVTRRGQRVELTPKEFSLLSLLGRHRDEIQSRTAIAEQVWDMNFDSDTNIVDVAVRRLRAKVDDPYPRKLIHSVRGVGYVLR